MGSFIRRETGALQGFWFGRSRETGVWRSASRRRMFTHRGRESFFIALGRWRLRIMKPKGLRPRPSLAGDLG